MLSSVLHILRIRKGHCNTCWRFLPSLQDATPRDKEYGFCIYVGDPTTQGAKCYRVVKGSDVGCIRYRKNKKG